MGKTGLFHYIQRPNWVFIIEEGQSMYVKKEDKRNQKNISVIQLDRDVLLDFLLLFHLFHSPSLQAHFCCAILQVKDDFAAASCKIYIWRIIRITSNK